VTTSRRAVASAVTLALSACGTARLYEGPPREPQEVARVFSTVSSTGQCESTSLQQVDGEETRHLLYRPDIVELEPGEHQLLYRVSYSGTGPHIEPQGYADSKGVWHTYYVTKCGEMYAYEIDVTVSVRAGYSYVPAVEMKGGPGPFEYQRLCLTGEPDEWSKEHWGLLGRVRVPSTEAQTLLCERGVFAHKWYD
jgi:hypothetical protein